MKRILPVFSLIAVAIDARNGFWQNMTKTISEDHLLKVFQSDLSLAQAAFDYQSSNDNSYLSIGCSSYKRGQEIGKR